MIDVKGRWLHNIEYLFQILVYPRDDEEQSWQIEVLRLQLLFAKCGELLLNLGRNDDVE